MDYNDFLLDASVAEQAGELPEYVESMTASPDFEYLAGQLIQELVTRILANEFGTDARDELLEMVHVDG